MWSTVTADGATNGSQVAAVLRARNTRLPAMAYIASLHTTVLFSTEI